ncbi:MAG: extra-cytoplasmic solute receptor BugT [Hyphomicrobiales bacterium]|nr:extra-cytoplasmic solute receptor BugT [Hyphomicrobiales bacterium]
MQVRSIALALAAVLTLSATAAQAQTYPNKPIRVIVPFAPGATTDLLGRVIAQHVQQAWGQTAIVENRAGAAGQLGIETTARSAPDGYTICVATGALAIYPAVRAKIDFDVLNDFEFIGLMARVPNVLLVHQSHPAKNLKEFIEIAKKEPGQNYSSTGAGTNTHFTGEMFKLAAGFDMQHVSYRGGAPAMTDLVAGHVKIMVASLTTALPHIKSGTIRALAVSSAERSYALPDVPTFKEQGYPTIETAEWWSLIAPKGTPKNIIDMWATEANKVMQDPSLKEKSPGIEVVTGNSADMRTLVEREMKTWKDVAQKANIKMD